MAASRRARSLTIAVSNQPTIHPGDRGTGDLHTRVFSRCAGRPEVMNDKFLAYAVIVAYAVVGASRLEECLRRARSTPMKTPWRSHAFNWCNAATAAADQGPKAAGVEPRFAEPADGHSRSKSTQQITMEGEGNTANGLGLCQQRKPSGTLIRRLGTLNTSIQAQTGRTPWKAAKERHHFPQAPSQHRARDRNRPRRPRAGRS